MSPNPAYFQQESERFYFRKLSLEDVDLWSEFFKNNDRLPFLGINANVCPRQRAAEWIQKQLIRYDSLGIGHLAVFRKHSHEFVGVSGILPKEVEKEMRYEVAYSLLPKFWGKGFATEIARHIKKFAEEELGLNDLISIIHLRNTDSAKVAIKNDMVIWKNTDYKNLPVHIYRYRKLKNTVL